MPTIAPPEPDLTPDAMMERARALRPLLRARQADCEALGQVPEDVNAQLIAAGFYRIVQPRRFGGYEFDVPTFYKVMMEIARGCTETGWVLALTAGHPMLISGFPEAGQMSLYGASGEFRCPAAFNPPGKAVGVDGGYRVSGAWVSASGCDLGTHFMGMAQVADSESPGKSIQMVIPAGQYTIADDWHVMGMRGTGSKSVVVDNVFVPEILTQETEGAQRGSEAVARAADLYDNPMYAGRVMPFLIGEAVAVMVGAARGALDHYETLLTIKRTMFPPIVLRGETAEFQFHYGTALALVSTAEAALVRAGEEYMQFAHEARAGGPRFDAARELRLTLIEQQCVDLAWRAVDLMYRTAGTTAAAKDGQPLGRLYRNLAVIRTHPALQLERFAQMAARDRLGLSGS